MQKDFKQKIKVSFPAFMYTSFSSQKGTKYFILAIQSEVCELAALMSPGSWLEMQNLSLSPDLMDQVLYFNTIPKRYICTGTVWFQKLCSSFQRQKHCEHALFFQPSKRQLNCSISISPPWVVEGKA